MFALSIFSPLSHKIDILCVRFKSIKIHVKFVLLEFGLFACRWAPSSLSWREQNCPWMGTKKHAEHSGGFRWIHRMQKRCSGAEFLHQVFDYLNLNEREFFGIQIIPHHHHGEFVVRTISL